MHLDQLLTTFKEGGITLFMLVFGVLGAMLGVAYSPQLSGRQMVAALLAGLACAMIFPQLLGAVGEEFGWKLLTLAPVKNGMAFLFGIGGMVIVPGLIAAWHDFWRDPGGTIQRIRGWFRGTPKEGGQP